MHARAILLLASVALPVIAAPVPTTNISPVPNVERRGVASLVEDLLRRASIIEAVPTIKRNPIDIEDLVERGGVKWSGKRDAEPTEDLVERGGVKWSGKRDAEPIEPNEDLVERGGVKWSGKREEASQAIA